METKLEKSRWVSPCFLFLSVACWGLCCLVSLPAHASDENDTGVTSADSESSEDDTLDDSDDDLGLDEEFALLQDEAVVQLPARHKQDVGMSPSAVTVLTREDIATSGATNIPDLLRLVPGMDVVIASPYSSSVISRMHWTYENNAYLVLIDGREANEDFLGQAPWEVQPIYLDDIERIEIIRGPGSALYGANAFAGVVSITTRAISDKTSAWVRVMGGEVGMFGSGARVSTRIGKLGLSISGGMDWANSFSLPDEVSKKLWKIRAVADYKFDDKRSLKLDMGVSKAEGSIPTGAGPVYGSNQFRAIRLEYDSSDLRAQLYWAGTPYTGRLDTSLTYNGLEIGKFVNTITDEHTIDAQLQYTIPEFWHPLMIIVGASARLNMMFSDQLLDPDTFLQDHEPGIAYYNLRSGAFLHTEISPADYVTITGGIRFDYNTETGSFLSPRLAAVFKPFENQFFRVGAARSFRKPSFLETRLHPDVEVPAGGIISEDSLREFMLKTIGNPDLNNESLWSVEAGWRGRFFDGALDASLDFYHTWLRNMIELEPIFYTNALELPDLDRSSALFQHTAPELNIFGWELAIRYSPMKNLSFLVSWSHKEIMNLELDKTADDYPKNLITIGGRFRANWGLVASCYLHTRSEFTDRSVDNPEGLMSGYLTYHNPDVMLVIARLGHRFSIGQYLQFEVGLRLFLPVSPFQEPYFRYYERAGGISDGRAFGGEYLRRVISGYVSGTF